jgi:hypothetical protein
VGEILLSKGPHPVSLENVALRKTRVAWQDVVGFGFGGLAHPTVFSHQSLGITLAKPIEQQDQ